MLMVATSSWPPLRMTGIAQRVEHALTTSIGVVRRVHALEQDDELVAAEPRQRVAGAHGPTQPFADDPEQLVADLVAEVVVDELEAVDVAEEHGHLAAGPVRLEQRVVEVVEQQPPVGQAGQRVLEGVTGQLLLERLALRCVAEDDHRARRRRATDDGRGGDVDREVRAVGPLEPGVVDGDVAPQGDGPHGRVEQEARRLARRQQAVRRRRRSGRGCTTRACWRRPGS